jgi:hypothetical protein
MKNTTDQALQVIKDGKAFAFTERDFAFVGVRLGNAVVVPYFRHVLYVVGVRVKGRWDDPAHAVPTALRRRSSGRVQFKG